MFVAATATAPVQLEETRRAAETRARNVGRPVSATDPDGGRVAYGLEGADAQAFVIDTNAQIHTKVGKRYDYEEKSRYSVTVRAQVESGTQARTEVTIVLVDLDEPRPSRRLRGSIPCPATTGASMSGGMPALRTACRRSWATMCSTGRHARRSGAHSHAGAAMSTQDPGTHAGNALRGACAGKEQGRRESVVGPGRGRHRRRRA